MKDLCLSLAYADTEAEITQILKDEGYWNSPGDWQFFAGMENSFSIIGNQQALPESALVEKIINSIDAVLMAECMKRGINPESEEAPRSIWEAVEEFYEIKDGLLHGMNPTERGKLAESAANVVVSGSRVLPSYGFIDFGEGQTANTMPKTLLSLAGSNKLRIPFVQGKFNMGGTGVILFSGDRHMQVMITKRHPGVAVYETDDDARNEWCFTVIRREDPREGQKHSVFTYLAPKGKILRFKAPSLPLFPGKYPEAYGEEVEHCTFIKALEYQIPRYKTNITLDMYNRLNCLLPRLALPVRLWERRRGWGAGTRSFETTLSGLSVRLKEDTRGMLEFSSSNTFSIDGTTLPTTIHAFKRKDQADRYRNEEGIIFVQNGQAQGHLPKDFFRRKRVGMRNIADLILVEVDCDAIGKRGREKLFMNSRDRLRSGQMKKDMEDQLQILINEHPGLREYRERRVREETKERLAKSRPLENVLEKIVKSNPTLAKLLGTGMRITSPFKETDASPTEKFKGKKHPTFFKLKTGKSDEYKKDAYIGQRFRVQFITDAEDNYFRRDEQPGELAVSCDRESYSSGIVNLWKGTATLSLELPEDSAKGNSYEFEVTVTDPTLLFPFKNSFSVIVKGDTTKSKPTEPSKRKDPTKKGKGPESKPTTLGIPKVFEVKKEDWDRHEFNRESGLKLRQDAEAYYFLVNVDNIYLKNEQKSSKDAALLKEQFKYGLSLIALALLNEYEKKRKNGNGNNDIEDDQEEKIDEEILTVTKAISPFILPMIKELGSSSLD